MAPMMTDPHLPSHVSTPTADSVLFGTTSWADRSLVSSGAFYPRRSMTARARLAYYASRFPLAEVATTYRFPPTPEVAAQWVERTPPGFTFDVRAWSLLTGAPTLPDSLWPDLQDEVRNRSRDLRRLYSSHLSAEALDECWARFDHALRPLHVAGKLGVVILQYPGWFSPRAEAWGELATVGRRLPDYRLAVELRSPKWFEGDACEGTLEWLEDRGLSLVCVDGPADGPLASPRVAAATADVAVVRFRRAPRGRRRAVDRSLPVCRIANSTNGCHASPSWRPRCRRCTSSWTTAGVRTQSTTQPVWRT